MTTKLKQHFKAIAAIVNPALNRPVSDGLTLAQRAYYRDRTVEDAQFHVHGALGTDDPTRGWDTAFNPVWNCEQSRKMHLDALNGIYETAPCLPCYRRKSRIDAATKVFFAPEPPDNTGTSR